MTPQRFIARITGTLLAIAFVAGISAGVYHDVGGWVAVATFWVGLAILGGLMVAFLWALENWNAR